MTARTVALALALGTLAPALHAQNLWPNWESPHVHPLELTPDGTRLLAVNTADQRLEVFDVSGLPICCPIAELRQAHHRIY